ncbi:MAG: mechanosensitive ion channel family protein [Pseudanabaenaceae cyanobacterium SKYGB_i_bin29]|nr:mechanosensitive ion channel family protein [Pseudanabaenaceae cyanobacterium SKYG29]MDW8420727.1 mechanosensitive ion channel family protein [Pseudanabaenaceae cyanobacterium SKYGB_i_bin29]
MNVDELVKTSLNLVTEGVLKAIVAIILWFVGRRLISFATSLVGKGLRGQRFDATLASYIVSSLGVLLNIVLVVAILGYFGIETTSFAALLAAAGVAIGAAWSGLLANFAAGVFLVIFQPFRVGDFVAAGGVEGTVNEIGLFVTTITTVDNIRTYVGNNRIFADNIRNFSANPYRRVDLVAQLDHNVNHQEAIRLLRERLVNIPNVVSNPAPELEILEFNLAGTVLAVRPYCHNDHYWQVYFDTNRVIRECFTEAEFPVPQHHLHIEQG